MKIEPKAGIFLSVTFCKGELEHTAVNSFISKLDAEIIREILSIDNLNIYRIVYGEYSIVGEKDIFKVKSKEHEFEIHKDLLLKLYNYLTELQESIDQLCNSKTFVYEYPHVKKDKSIACISLDPNIDSKQHTGLNINGTDAMGGDECYDFTRPLFEGVKNEKVNNTSSGQNILLSRISAPPVSSTFDLDNFNSLTCVDTDQTFTDMDANDSGFIGHVGMNTDQLDDYIIPSMSPGPKNEKVQNISSGQNIVDSSSIHNIVPLAASPVSNPSTLDQFNKQPSTPPSVTIKDKSSISSGNFEDQFFNARSKPNSNYKGLLQEMLSKNCTEFVLPTYSYVKEGDGNSTRFSASVEVTLSDNVTKYESPIRLKRKGEAEQAAAEVAYNALKESIVGGQAGGQADLDEDMKMLLHWHTSRGLIGEPIYNVVQCYGHYLNNFKCTVTYNKGTTIEGPVEKNKKLAKKQAASMAWKAIDSLGTR